MSATTPGWWRPAGGCHHDVCDFTELDVAAWRAHQNDPRERLLRLVDELLSACIEESTRADEPIPGQDGGLQQWDAAERALAPGAAIPATSSAEESDPDIHSLALDVWGDDFLGPEDAS
jgi:hypothetical protein